MERAVPMHPADPDLQDPPAPERELPDAGLLQHWYPAAFERDLAASELTRITVFGRGFVLFRNDEGEISGLPDRCPHRSARLSDGRLVNGQVECLYHGWKFESGGACVHIPQLPEGGQIPTRACLDTTPVRVVDGLVWIFPGENPASLKGAAPPEPMEALARDDVHVIDFATDLPYTHAALIENVLDFAHIHIAHDGVRGGGHRSHAGPLRFEVEDRGAGGFTARFLSSTSDGSDAKERTTGATVAFDAPHLVHYVSTFNDPSKVSGLALYALPLDEHRCRLLYRAYGNTFPDEDRRRPRWKEHLHQMFLLEQDMSVVLGQSQELRSDELQADGGGLREAWLPIKSSDPLVILYAKWIDAHGQEAPGALGWSTRAPAAARAEVPATDRWTLHTRHCSDCLRAKDDLERGVQGRLMAAAGLTLLAAILPFPWGIAAAALAAAAGLWARSMHAQRQALVKDPLGQRRP